MRVPSLTVSPGQDPGGSAASAIVDPNVVVDVGHFRLGDMMLSDGSRYLLVQYRSSSGRYSTILGITSSGNLYTAGSTTGSYGFEAAGLNPMKL